ncbi:MAG: TusE/DsrC/DsvC family sulfur relay protein [Thermodesulfobacteriota bacterium]
MKELLVKNKKIVVDSEGFLANIEDWDEDIAREIATREGLEILSSDKMEIVRFMREYYKKFHAFPILNYVCKNLHQPRQCVSEKFINPMKAWKIAGLPHPSGIQFVAADGKHYHMEECC